MAVQSVVGPSMTMGAPEAEEAKPSRGPDFPRGDATVVTTPRQAGASPGKPLGARGATLVKRRLRPRRQGREEKWMDIAIINGTVVDGTGAPRVRADVGITDDRIVAVGELRERAGRTIDAAGRTVAPGFIDAHAPTDTV